MSHRSHVANSGSSPIEQCSAAWAEPGQVGGEEARAPRAGRRGASTTPPGWGGSARAGRAAPRRSRRPRAAGGGGTTPPGGRPRPCRARSGPRPRCGGRSPRTTVIVGELAGRRGVGHLGPVDHRDVVVEVERLDEPGLAAVDVDRAGVGGRVGARGVDRADHPPGGALDQRDRPAAAGADVGEGVGRLGMGPVPAPGAGGGAARTRSARRAGRGCRDRTAPARLAQRHLLGGGAQVRARGRRGSRGRRRSARRPGRAAPRGG